MDGWHEDFGDEPSVEERYPDERYEPDDWFGYEDYEREVPPDAQPGRDSETGNCPS